MQSSLGHAEYSIGDQRAGEFRVSSLDAPHAMGPRLAVSIDCVAHDLGPGRFFGEEGVSKYRLMGLVGELRLDRETHPFCVLHWLGAGHWVESVNYFQPYPVQMAADLDPARIELLARHATEQGLTLYLQLWPTFIKADHALRAKAELIRVGIPIEVWARLLGAWRREEHEIVLVRWPLAYAGRFRASLEAVTAAETLIDQARYGEALARCRTAVERLAVDVQEARGTNSMKDAFGSFVGERKSEHYAAVAAQLKALGNIQVHGSSEAAFTRSEALFAVRCTKSLLELYGSFLTR